MAENSFEMFDEFIGINYVFYSNLVISHKWHYKIMLSEMVLQIYKSVKCLKGMAM